MRKSIVCLAAMLFVASVFAGSEPTVLPLESPGASITPNLLSSADSVTATVPVSGFLQDLEIISGYGTVQTCAVWIVVATNYATQVERTIYTNAAFTGSKFFSPRYPVQDSAGTDLWASTNQHERMFFSGDIIKAYFWESTGTNNCNLKIRLKICQ